METLEKPKRITTDIRVIEFDESEHWRDDILKACGGKITTVYMFDANQFTNCCELEPSFYLVPIYSNPEASYDDIPTEIQNEFEMGCLEDTDGIYVHCKSIDLKKTIKSHCNGRYTQSKKDVNKKYQEIWDGAEEYLRGNHLI